MSTPPATLKRSTSAFGNVTYGEEEHVTLSPEMMATIREWARRENFQLTLNFDLSESDNYASIVLMYADDEFAEKVRVSANVDPELWREYRVSARASAPPRPRQAQQILQHDVEMADIGTIRSSVIDLQQRTHPVFLSIQPFEQYSPERSGQKFIEELESAFTTVTTDEVKRDQLMSLVKGEVKEVMLAAKPRTYEDMRTIVITEFGRDSNSCAKFVSDFRPYRHRINNISEAYDAISKASRHTMGSPESVRIKFLLSNIPEELTDKIVKKNPRSFREAGEFLKALIEKRDEQTQRPVLNISKDNGEGDENAKEVNFVGQRRIGTQRKFRRAKKRDEEKDSDGEEVIRCHRCGELNYYAKDCRKKNVNKKNVNSKKTFGTGERSVHEITSTEKPVNAIVMTGETPTMFTATVKVEGREMEVLLDTGSAANVMNLIVWENLNSKNPFKKNSVVLKSANQTCLRQVGSCILSLEVGGVKRECVFFIVKDSLTRTILGSPALVMFGGNINVRTGVWIFNNDDVLTQKSEMTLRQLSISAIHTQMGNLEESARNQLWELLARFPEVLKDKLDRGAQCVVGMCEINLTSPEPIYVNRKFNRSSPVMKEAEETIISELLQQGVIVESQSPFQAPGFLVPKKNKEYRLVIDYRLLNAKTIQEHFPIPSIDELMEKLNGALFFSTVDLASGYFKSQ